MFTGRCKTTLKLALQIACLIICAEAVVLKDVGKKVANSDGGCARDYNVDYLDLAITWGPGVCSTEKVDCKREINNKFTIHGLWPQQKQHSSPIYCCTDTFYSSGEVKTIKNQLREHWPAIDLQRDDTFWPYEWDKHGSCAVRIKGVNTVLDYFKFTLEAFKRWDLKKILEKNGYHPSNQNYYYGQEIVSKLSKAVGHQVSIDCVPSKKNPSILVFTQVHICFNKKLELIDCRNTSRKCRDKIRFPLSV